MQYIKKVTLCTFLLLVMVLAAASVGLAGSGTVNDNGVNVRSGPGTNYSVLNTLTKGTGVTILSTKGEWQQIQYGSLKGWVKTSFISAGSSTGSSTYRLQVTGDLVNLRSGPDTGYSQVGQVKKGDILTVIDVEGNWYKVKTSSGTSAYILSDYVAKEGAASPNAPVTSKTTAVSAPYVQITSGPANIRSSPDSSSSKLTMLENGTICPVLGRQGDWYKIRLSSGSVGYVASWLVKETKTAPAGTSTAPTAAPTVTEKPIAVVLNGKTLSFEVAPVIDNGNTLVPLRTIFEALGASVKWDGATRTVTAARGDTNVVLTVGSTSPTVNGEVHKIAAPARIIKDRTLVPMRFVAEAFGAIVKWDAATRTITITSAEGNSNDGDNKKETATPANAPGPDVVRLSRLKDETGLKISMQSGAELKCDIDEGDGKVTYEFPDRRIEGLFYFEEKLGSSLVKVRGSSEDGKAIVTIEFPSDAKYKTASENGGKTEVFTIVNSILRVECKKFGASGANVVVTTATPVKYTHQLQGDSIVVKLPNVVKGGAEGEYTFDNDLVKSLKISEETGQTLLTLKVNDLGKYTTGVSSSGTDINIMMVGKSGIKNHKNLVVLDPGHGGKDTGARGSSLDEKDVNLAIAMKVGDILKRKGIEVMYTRSADTYVTLEDRCKIANEANAGLFVSIHNNASPDSTKQGTETYYYAPLDDPDLFIQQDERQALAGQLQQNLTKALGRSNRGVKQANFAVLRETNMPSALVEIMFISNPDEQGLLLQEYTRNRAAEAIADAIAAAMK